MAAHAPLALSFAPVWGHCSLAPTLAAQFPQAPTEDTLEGEASHWCAEMTLKGGPMPAIGAIAPNGVVITTDMRDAAQIFVNDVQAAIALYRDDPGLVGACELTIACTSIHPIHCWGTPDYFLYSPKHRILLNWNFKYGHREVNEFEDLQEVGYVSGEIDFLGIDGHAEQYLTVDIRIVQPRCWTPRGIVRSWKVPATSLRSLYNRLIAQAQQAFTAPVGTSGNHCVDCSGAAHCEAARKSSYAVFDYVGRPTAEPLTPEIVSFELQLLERMKSAIKARETNMEAAAEAMIKQEGKIIPGYGIESKASALSWDIPLDVIKAVNPACVKEEAITPTQAVNRRLIDESVIRFYASRKTSSPKFVKQDSSAIRRILGANSNG